MLTTVLIALGSNRRHPVHGAPRQVIYAAVLALQAAGMEIDNVSNLYSTAPWGPPQPRFINAALKAKTTLPVTDLMALLHSVEADFGRQRSRRWGPRVIDLDLIAYATDMHPARLQWQSGRGLCVPHKLAHLRPFVLIPLMDVAPDWRHPVTSLTVRQMAFRLQSRFGLRCP